MAAAAADRAAEHASPDPLDFLSDVLAKAAHPRTRLELFRAEVKRLRPRFPAFLGLPPFPAARSQRDVFVSPAEGVKGLPPYCSDWTIEVYATELAKVAGVHRYTTAGEYWTALGRVLRRSSRVRIPVWEMKGSPLPASHPVEEAEEDAGPGAEEPEESAERVATPPPAWQKSARDREACERGAAAERIGVSDLERGLDRDRWAHRVYPGGLKIGAQVDGWTPEGRPLEFKNRVRRVNGGPQVWEYLQVGAELFTARAGALIFREKHGDRVAESEQQWEDYLPILDFGVTLLWENLRAILPPRHEDYISAAFVPPEHRASYGAGTA